MVDRFRGDHDPAVPGRDLRLERLPHSARRTQLEISATQASLPFSIVLIFFALATVLGGRLQDKMGPRSVAILGGVLLAIGMMLASASHSIGMLVLSYGIISGIGIGFAYVCPISAGVKWFPDKRGLITGLAVAGFGAGGFFVAPLAAGLISGTPYKLLGAALFGLPKIGVFKTFLVLGIAYLVLIVLGGLILRNPPAGYVPAGLDPLGGGGGQARERLRLRRDADHVASSGCCGCSTSSAAARA